MQIFQAKSKFGTLLVATWLLLSGCGPTPEPGHKTSDLPYPGGAGPQWVYNGPLPALEDPSVVVSLKGHTVRVTGFLPAGFSEPLPYYAVTDVVGERTRLTVVYPIATGDLSAFNANGSAVRNAPGRYSSMIAYPRKVRNSIAEWGGFPFLVYNTGREIGFHGPITHNEAEWKLKRGPVSHGCNRMQGEHLVEMAFLLGVDMKDEVYPAGASEALTVPTRVMDMADGYDRWNGQSVDVDYPVQAGVSRPRENVRLFPTWDARELPRSVCQYRASRELGSEHCAYRPANQIDIITGGRPLGKMECPTGYVLQSVGTRGGQICSDGVNAWGPFTQAMVQQCLAWGGGEQACRSDRWSEELTLRARGTGICPNGAVYDVASSYCVEGDEAFGPFPSSLVAKCEAAGGGSACRSSRWSRSLLLRLMAVSAS